MAEGRTGSKALEYWKDEIRRAVRYRTIFGKSKEWALYKNMYRGFWAKEVVPVNIIYAIARSIIPQVYFRNPRVGVIAAKPGYTMHARVLERIDNYLIRELWLKNEFKSMILNCYFSGRGPGILGYDTEYGFNPSFLSDEMEDSSLTTFNKKGEKIEYTENVKPGMPWFLSCNPLDFVVPWGTSRWESARWFAMRKMRMLKDIKEDPKYKNKSKLRAAYKSKLESSTESRPEGSTPMHEEDAENAWVELWEIHDKRTGRVLVISLDHDKFLRDDFDYLQLEGLPARVLGFNEDPDFFWWVPDARQIIHQQNEMNDIRTMAKKHRRVALLKALVDKNAVNKDEITKLLDQDPKAVVRIDPGPTGDIRKSVALFQSHVPPDLTIAAREVREDIREIIGFSRNQMGSFEEASGRRTAHEAEIVRAASMIRIDERRDIVADMLESVLRGMNQIIFDNWTTERVVDVVGDDGAKYWVRFTGREIRGEFNFKVNPEEAIPEDRRTRRAEALQFMQTIAQAQIPDLNMRYLIEQYAAQFDWLDPKMLFPGEGAGRSPEKAMMFGDFIKRGPQGAANSSFPGLA